MTAEKDKDTEMEVIPRSTEYYQAAEAKSLEFMNPKRWEVMKAMSNTFIGSGALPESIKNAAQLMMVMQAGYEAGMQPIESINAFYIVNGKLTMYGDAVTSQVIRAGHKVEWGECNDQTATVTITRGDNENKMTGTFTLAQAEKRGLLKYNNGNDNPFWKKYPENMLKYKALGSIVDFITPDALRGVSVKEVIESDMDESKGTSPLAAATEAIANDDAPVPKSDEPAKSVFHKPNSLADSIASGRVERDTAVVMKTRQEFLEENGYKVEKNGDMVKKVKGSEPIVITWKDRRELDNIAFSNLISSVEKIDDAK